MSAALPLKAAAAPHGASSEASDGGASFVGGLSSHAGGGMGRMMARTRSVPETGRGAGGGRVPGESGIFANQPLSQRRYTAPSPGRRRYSLSHRFGETPPCEATRLAGQYAVPLAGPDLQSDNRPIIGEEDRQRLFASDTEGCSPWVDSGFGSASGRWLPLCLVAVFLCADSSRYIMDVSALRENANRHILAQVLVWLQSILGFASALLATVCMQGCSGLKAAFKPFEVLRCLPISVGFSLSQAALAHAFSQGCGAAVAVALGFLYMPLSALISRWMFRRPYGWLETHALVLLTLSILTFSELRSRALSFSMETRGTGFLLISVVLSCLSSLLAEWVLKPKYSPGNEGQFYIQKVRLEVWGVITSFLVLKAVNHERLATSLEGWDARLTAALTIRVVQVWLAGVMAKHLSTVAKAVIQCLSMLIVFFFGDLVVFQVGIGGVEISLLAIVVALSAFLYQMGRRSTLLAQEEMEAAAAAAAAVADSIVSSNSGGVRPTPAPSAASEPTPTAPALLPSLGLRGGASAALADVAGLGSSRQVSLLDRDPRRSRPRSRSLGGGEGEDEVEGEEADDRAVDSSPSYAVAGANVLAPLDFHLDSSPHGHRSLDGHTPSAASSARRRSEPFEEEPGTGLVDGTWLEEALVYNAGCAQWLTSRKGVIAQVFCVATFIVSDASRTLIYEWSLNGSAIVQQSLVVAMSGASIIVGVVFAGCADGSSGLCEALSLREALRCLPVAACFSFGQTFQIYAYGVGVSAVENTVLGYFYMPLSAMLSRWIFRRAYSPLEWLSLLLLMLSACVFVMMQDSRDSGGSGDGIDALGVSFVLGSVALSCLGSILAEKIMKTGHCPFYIQKVHLEVGGLLAAVVMMFISGLVSDRPNDAFWHKRDIGGGHMEAGIFVGWTPKIVLALVASSLQSWLGGLVSKLLSTVTRAVAQCLSLLLIYFVGDLLLKQLPFDWPLGSMACVVALTVQVFAQAGRRLSKSSHASPSSATAAAPQEPAPAS